MIDTIIPEWPAPSCVNAFTTTRWGGISHSPYHELNLAMHVGDDNNAVMHNRDRLVSTLSLPQAPCWLNQVHGTQCVRLDDKYQQTLDADAAICKTPNQVLVIMTADCLPILLTNQSGSEVAAIHGGWRSLLNGVIDETIQQFQSPPSELMAWLGPAIGPTQFQLNAQIRVDFLQRNKQNSNAFEQKNNNWFADIYELARINLRKLGVTHCYGGGFCTVSDERFFSYRREQTTGRMASIIWITQ